MDRAFYQKKYLLPLLALISPLLFFLILEIFLWLLAGEPQTQFFIPCKIDQKKFLCHNPRFGAWLFLPPSMNRSPLPFKIPAKKELKTTRICVLGESAAQGIPNPAFGFARQLKVLLEKRYPSEKFEIINGAIVALNSHAMLKIANECVKQQADMLLVYMGNNEVVGPFGAGTIFNTSMSSLTLIKLSLFVKSSNTGQFFLKLLEQMIRPKADWKNMSPFGKEQNVAMTDKRLPSIYSNFKKNLEDILEFSNTGTKIILSTVAVNLDFAPFASKHKETLSEEQLKRWQEHYKKGNDYYQKAQWIEAIAEFLNAEKIDDEFAELQYLLGKAYLKVGQSYEGKLKLLRARDLDTLRFRADSEINSIIKEAKKNYPEVQLIEADNIFEENSPNFITDQKFFLEHVHFKFDGNFLLAKLFLKKIEEIFPRLKDPKIGRDKVIVQRTLAFTRYDEIEQYKDMTKLLSQQPFKDRPGNNDTIELWKKEIHRLETEGKKDNWQTDLYLYQTARSQFLGDPLFEKNDQNFRRFFASQK